MSDGPVRLVSERERYQQDAAKVLRHLAERAERGEFVCVVVAAECTDGRVLHRVTGSPDFGTTVGRLEVLKAQLVRKALGE